MQKILCALVAIFSLLSANLRPTQAQGNSPSADPPPAPQQMDEQAGGARHPERALPDRRAEGNAEFIVRPEQRVANVAVSDLRLILQGHVEKDVLAVNCDVLIEKGATVGGHLVTIGGKVENQAGEGVKVVQEGAEMRHALQQNPSQTFVAATWTAAPPPVRIAATAEKPIARHDWLGGQFALLILGLLGTLLLRVAAPRATEEVAETIALEPGRALLIGGLSAVGILLVLTVNAELLRSNSFFGLIWKPIGFAIALAPLVPMVLGWLAGMRYAGNLIARRLGRPEQAGLFGRMLLGLFAFFAVNAFCGMFSEGLGVIGLTLECAFAVMGLGAALMTGFGTRPNWMTARSHH